MFNTKLILSSEAIQPPLTGIGRYTWELARRLPDMLGKDNIRFYHQGCWVADPASLLDPTRPNIRRNWLQRQEPSWARTTRLKWACRGKIFHGPNYFLPACADIGVATIHDLSVFKYPETHPIERIKQFEREFTKTISRAAHLITDTETTRQEVIEFLSWPVDKITAVPLGVSADFKPRSEEMLTPYLNNLGLTANSYSLCVSTMEPRKKIGNLLQAYQRLPHDTRQHMPLVLAGGAGWLSDALHDEIERCSRQGWLQYLGFVPEADLPLLYAGARLFVYPSAYEGFGLPVLEAMASGTPVVAANVSTLPEITHGAAILTNPDDIEKFANDIERALYDCSWIASTKALGLKVASEYSWERCVQQTVSVYKKTLATG